MMTRLVLFAAALQQRCLDHRSLGRGRREVEVNLFLIIDVFSFEFFFIFYIFHSPRPHVLLLRLEHMHD